ncbi:MAG: hypothetical protein R6W95_04960 [Desulfosarcina sp.]
MFPPGKLQQVFTGVIPLGVVVGLQALKLYPTRAYQLVTSGSEESLHSIPGRLQTKALMILSEDKMQLNSGTENDKRF